jgi:hypothetical protein
MTDPGELAALKAAVRGVQRSGDGLTELSTRVDALDPHVDIPDETLEDLRRITSAHAVAAQALRGLVQTILKRRGKVVEEAVGGSSGGDAES